MPCFRLPAVLLFAALAACAPAAPGAASEFPAPDRPVAAIVASHSNPEPERDAVREAERIAQLIGAGPGKTIADIGAGDGYLTVRLAPRLAPGGRVIAVDVVPSYLDGLKRRVAAAGLDNVQFVLGAPDDARLPAASVDVAVMVRMYHEIEQPYALLWRLRDALKPGGIVAVAERDRPTRFHGAPPALLRCEFAAVGYRQIAFHDLGPETGYLALFAPTAPRPEPGAIKPCKG
ncbi:MAG: methyltransferase domain-containing protein [Alphaproteobacteria bacterium]|nr:methyltransferase domain-containing protein [Alphaproteobacteria bacterium]